MNDRMDSVVIFPKSVLVLIEDIFSLEGLFGIKRVKSICILYISIKV